MIVWKRGGILVLVAVGLAMATFAVITNVFGLTKTMGSNKAWSTVMMYGFFLPALYNYLITKIFLKDEKEEIYTNERGEKVKINNYSSLFFIRNKYWTFILLAIFAMVAYTTYKAL